MDFKELLMKSRSLSEGCTDVSYRDIDVVTHARKMAQFIILRMKALISPYEHYNVFSNVHSIIISIH